MVLDNALGAPTYSAGYCVGIGEVGNFEEVLTKFYIRCPSQGGINNRLSVGLFGCAGAEFRCQSAVTGY